MTIPSIMLVRETCFGRPRTLDRKTFSNAQGLEAKKERDEFHEAPRTTFDESNKLQSLQQEYNLDSS